MNYALIFAGGVGSRMGNPSIPKQFLTVEDKPIIIYTIEKFEKCNDIDGILIVCIKDWITELKQYLLDFNITKVLDVIPGGQNGQESIFNGLKSLNEKVAKDSIVLIHDGVRPLIDNETIMKNIYMVKKYKSCITCSPSIETIIKTDENNCINDIIDRNKCRMARAPQSFYLKDILNTHLLAQKENYVEAIDSATLMRHFGYSLYTLIGPAENIKITTPSDYYMFKSFIEEYNKNKLV